MAQPPEDRVPVIVGVGEITDKPANPAQGLEPLALVEATGMDRIPVVDNDERLVGLVCWNTRRSVFCA